MNSSFKSPWGRFVKNIWHVTAFATLLAGALTCDRSSAAVGDPQIRTDHDWYPGELSCSTFERLFATQAEVYRRVVGREPGNDEDKALASWLWRNTHYWHGEEGTEDLWGKGFTAGGEMKGREYWTGLFAHGFSLCGTTHAQWCAESQALLGHNRGRTVGVAGHNSFEVFLKGGAYGDGRWALLDHDISTVIFNDAGTRLLSIPEVSADLKRLTDRRHQPQKQHGWPVSGLHPQDGAAYKDYTGVEYLAGYGGPPPIVKLRRGETLRRYLEPGLDDGKTFVYWGRNYNTAGVPGPERSLTWVNQPDKMHGGLDGVKHRAGQARYANAVYHYVPNFKNDSYQEGVAAETDHSVTFEFYTPYIIAATPANDKPWGIYDAGCRNGLVLHGKADCPVEVSVDQGATFQPCGKLTAGLDLTDYVKGHRQYWLRFGRPAKLLADAKLEITTVCQASGSIMPRLRDGGTTIHFAKSDRGIISAGPNLKQAQTHVIAGKFGSPRVSLELATPRGEPIVGIYAAGHLQSSSPPQPDVNYQIEYSLDGGRRWQPLVKDWKITRRGEEPKDFWSQSFCWGNTELGGTASTSSTAQLRFSNTGGKNYLRCEAHLLYSVNSADRTKITFAWSEGGDKKQAEHTFVGGANDAWKISTGKNVQTHWVEYAVVP